MYPDRIEAHDDDGRVALHERSFERGEVRYDWRHYIPLVERTPGALRIGAPFDGLPTSLQHLRTALLKHLGGDRLMADVLACVPRNGLEAVVVAAELIVTAGNTSAEHIKNVLSRLHEATLPAVVETALKVQDPPIADAGCYDRLRGEVHHA